MTTRKATINLHVLRCVSVVEQLPLLVSNSSRIYLDVYTVKLRTSSTVTSANRQTSFKVKETHIFYIFTLSTVLLCGIKFAVSQNS